MHALCESAKAVLGLLYGSVRASALRQAVGVRAHRPIVDARFLPLVIICEVDGASAGCLALGKPRCILSGSVYCRRQHRSCPHRAKDPYAFTSDAFRPAMGLTLFARAFAASNPAVQRLSNVEDPPLDSNSPHSSEISRRKVRHKELRRSWVR